MSLYPAFALVRVPFPFTDRAIQKRRPALVVSTSDFQRQSGHLVLAMVTSANQSRWPLDWPIQELTTTGLPKPCLVRFKLFSLDERLILGALGHLAAEDSSGVAAHLRQILPLI